MYIKNKTASGAVQLLSITALALCLFPTLATAQILLIPSASIAEPLISFFDFIGNVLTIAAVTISEFYFSYIHSSIVSIISATWPENWPQYDAMLASYQTLFYKIPLWFTGNLWPTSWFGSFPLWGIDLFLTIEIFYIALRLITRRAKPFTGSRFIKFMKSMVYETWIFIKSPFFAASSILFFLLRGEKEKRRILLFWLYTIILTSIVVAIVAWYAQS